MPAEAPDEWAYPEPVLEVADNPVIGVIYGPDGGVLAEVLERPVHPFGFQPPGEVSACPTRRPRAHPDGG